MCCLVKKKKSEALLCESKYKYVFIKTLGWDFKELTLE